MQQLSRCQWCGADPLYIAYHDQEWGVPLYDPQQLFEFLMLEGMQAGLSWITILRKREHLRHAFAGFQPEKLLRFTAANKARLLKDPGIIRHAGKIQAVIDNAKLYVKLQEKGQSFADLIWQFTEGKVIINRWRVHGEIPTTSAHAKSMAKTLKALGFRFVGETICYAFMQAVGIVNDHVVSCYRYPQLLKRESI